MYVYSHVIPAIIVFALAIGLETSLAYAVESDLVHVSIRKGSTAGGLNVSHPLLPGNTIAYLSCEAVVFADKGESTPLFEVTLTEEPNESGAHWTVRDNRFTYSWTYDAGIKVDFAATPENTGLRLTYTLTNVSDSPMKRVIVHTCIPTTDAPAFFPDSTEVPVHESGKEGNYMEFYDRTFLWSNKHKFTVGQTEKGKDEIHLSFTRQGQPPVTWGWWNDGVETFDLPLIAVQNRDGAFTAALAFEAAEWASCNGGDDRACFHLFPLFGDLNPGESKTIEGCFYLMPGTADDAYAQFTRDFPAVAEIHNP